MLFGTSGIRDIYGAKITPALAMGIGNAFAEKGESIAVASDLRQTSELLKAACVSGILAVGANAVDLGTVPTPTLALYTQEKKCKGLMITASHNPQEYNGFKLYRNGHEIYRNEEEKVAEHYVEEFELCEWNEAGHVSQYANAVRDHIEMAKCNVDAARIRAAKLKVVVDTNGVGTMVTPLLLQELGCEVVEINKVSLGFARLSEPNDANLSKLKAEVKARKAHLGIAHDGDADRAIIVDEKGELLGLDVQFAIAIGHELIRRKGSVVSTVEASLLIKEMVEKSGGKDIVVRVGSTNVSERMEKTPGAVFGGEPAGEYIYKNGVNSPDGILTAAKFVEIAAEGRLSERKRAYMPYPMLREKFACADREKAMERIMKKLSLGGKRNTIDGIREDFQDGFVLVRASGTEHAIRLTAEFRSQGRLDEMAERARKAIKEQL
ncbi:Phosphoglucosamine mutase [uncultured archaeon]|nr:Phosphoglucosamine mutase [uncultured archaeon]